MLDPSLRLSRDELRDRFAQLATKKKLRIRTLNVQDYARCRREGLPLPVFSRGISRTVRLDRDAVEAAAMSPLSPEDYEAATGVDSLIVKDIRKRHLRREVEAHSSTSQGVTPSSLSPDDGAARSQ